MYFTREDWKLFRNIETLSQKAGMRKEMIPALVVKELVDNALDAGANCSVRKLNSLNGFSVTDDGPGIPSGRLSELFSINRPMVSSKLLRLSTRGALGNGLRVVMGAVIATNGSIFIGTGGKEYQLLPQEDGTTTTQETGKNAPDTGTTVTVIFGDSVRFSYSDLTLGERAIGYAVGEASSPKTSPFWYTSESFFELLNAYSSTLESLVSFFKIDHILAAKDALLRIDHCPLYKDTNKMSFEQSEAILKTLREHCFSVKKAPKIGMVGKKIGGYFQGYKKQTGFFHVESARGVHDATIPYVVEGWTYVEPGMEEPQVVMMVNKTPITGEINVYKKDSKKISIFGCGISHWFRSKPAQIVINVQTPYMPITSDGKSPNFRPMLSSINKVIESSARIAAKACATEDTRKFNTEKDVILDCMDAAIEKASGGGIYKFSQRQLYYAVRPYVISRLDKEPEYNYFCKVLTDYEALYGDIPNLYRDPRGILYHPHLGEEIPVGTIAVENYIRPSWTFNKILYSEKEGFFTILRDAKFPERYDCALLTSKGYASRAVKDLFDLLGDTDEEIYFYCIHDADAAGSKIYETLQGETMARPKRRIKIINLGLDPEEALEMGLEVEKTPDTKRRKPVADYLQDTWKDWLQENRVELNAMTSPQFLAWLENKMEEHGVPKVIPNNAVMKEALESNVSKLLEAQIAQDILQQAGYEERVQAEFNKLKPYIEKTSLKKTVQADLEENQEHHWTKSIKTIAEKLVV